MEGNTTHLDDEMSVTPAPNPLGKRQLQAMHTSKQRCNKFLNKSQHTKYGNGVKYITAETVFPEKQENSRRMYFYHINW